MTIQALPNNMIQFTGLRRNRRDERDPTPPATPASTDTVALRLRTALLDTPEVRNALEKTVPLSAGVTVSGLEFLKQLLDVTPAPRLVGTAFTSTNDVSSKADEQSARQEATESFIGSVFPDLSRSLRTELLPLVEGLEDAGLIRVDSSFSQTKDIGSPSVLDGERHVPNIIDQPHWYFRFNITELTVAACK